MGKRGNSLFVPYKESHETQKKHDSTDKTVTDHVKRQKTVKASMGQQLRQKHQHDYRATVDNANVTPDNTAVTSAEQIDTDHVTDAVNRPRKRVRSNHERPQELSSSQPVSRIAALQASLAHTVKTYKPADPRFTAESSFNETMYNRAYGFINDLKHSEIDEIKAKLGSRSLTAEQKAELKTQLQQHQQREKQQQHKHQQKAVLQQWKKNERQMQAHGKTAYHMKASEQRKLLLAQKYVELKGSGHSAVNKYMEKKQKQQAQSSRKFIPNQ